MRAVGKALSPCLTIQDMIQVSSKYICPRLVLISTENHGKDLFRTGLSQLPDTLFRKVYVAKHVLRDCILGHLSANLCKIDAREKMKDVILEMHKQDRSQLAAISEDLEFFRAEAMACGNTVDDDIAYRHAVYTDELTALTSTNIQLNLMSDFSDPKPTSNNSESVMSNEPGGSSGEAEE